MRSTKIYYSLFWQLNVIRILNINFFELSAIKLEFWLPFVFNFIPFNTGVFHCLGVCRECLPRVNAPWLLSLLKQCLVLILEKQPQNINYILWSCYPLIGEHPSDKWSNSWVTHGHHDISFRLIDTLPIQFNSIQFIYQLRALKGQQENWT